MSPEPALAGTQEGTARSFFVLQVYDLDVKKYVLIQISKDNLGPIMTSRNFAWIDRHVFEALEF